jgi:hypothetical protein
VSKNLAEVDSIFQDILHLNKIHVDQNFYHNNKATHVEDFSLKIVH